MQSWLKVHKRCVADMVVTSCAKSMQSIAFRVKMNLSWLQSPNASMNVPNFATDAGKCTLCKALKTNILAHSWTKGPIICHSKHHIFEIFGRKWQICLFVFVCLFVCLLVCLLNFHPNLWIQFLGEILSPKTHFVYKILLLTERPL